MLKLCLRKNHSFKSGLSSPTSPSVPKNTNNQAKNSQLDGSTAQFVSISSQAQSIQINSLGDSRIQQQYFYLDKYQKLKQQVSQQKAFVNNPDWDVDPWEVDLEITIIILSGSGNDSEEVKKVLSQSPQLRE